MMKLLTYRWIPVLVWSKEGILVPFWGFFVLHDRSMVGKRNPAISCRHSVGVDVEVRIVKPGGRPGPGSSLGTGGNTGPRILPAPKKEFADHFDARANRRMPRTLALPWRRCSSALDSQSTTWELSTNATTMDFWEFLASGASVAAKTPYGRPSLAGYLSRTPLSTTP